MTGGGPTEHAVAQTIGFEQRGAIAVLTLQRPEKLNAIDAGMLAALQRGLDRAEADASVRAVVLRGQGRAFSAGFDLGPGGAEKDAVAMRAELRSDFDAIMRFWDFPKPTIAAVHGYCLGSALEIALASDLSIASHDCRFGAPEVQFGSGIVALLLPWFCGPKRAKELLLTGTDKVTAAQAESWGLINRVVDADQLRDSARQLALSIAQNDQLAVKLTKQAINRGYDTAGLRKALLDALELDVEIESTETPDSKAFNQLMEKEGTRAAIEWRRKQFA
jgi:enoyl-CoA hydratase